MCRRKIRKWLAMVALVGLIAVPNAVMAQIAVLKVIKAGVKKVIKAIDLQIQRQQNKVIWLQNAQKTLENEMSKTRLGEITSFVQQQKDLYQQYYDELATVRSFIASYKRVKEVTEMQIGMVSQYRKAWALLNQDNNFSAGELEQIGKVYAGMLDHGIANLEQVTRSISGGLLTMSDAQRIDQINAAADRLRQNYTDLLRFTNSNVMLGLQKAKEKGDVDKIRSLYGIR